MRNQMIFIGLFAMMLMLPVFTMAKTSFDVETGYIYTGMSDVRIPGDTGTLFSLSDDFKSETPPFIRIRLNQSIGERHTISALYAPLTIKADGKTNRDIQFTDTLFPSGSELDATYRFNSYRLTYRYDVVHCPNTVFGMGFTAKIRDAEIALKGEGLSASKKNVGFVPIINFKLDQNLSEKLGFILEGDALAAPQGRAEDVSLTLAYKASEHFRIRLGYRVLEGGADNDEVYNFALLHYALLGIELTR